MRWRAARRAVAVGLVAMAAAACTNGNAAQPPGATVGTEPPRTTTTDPYAVPSVIDAAYVNRILAGLDAVSGDVTRMVVATKTIPREAYDRLKAVYATDGMMNRILDSLSRDVAFRLSQYRPQPGNKISTVSDLITARPTCIFAKVSRDYAAVALTPPALTTQWVAVVPSDPGRDPAQYNRVGWSFTYEGLEQDGGPPPRNPCTSF